MTEQNLPEFVKVLSREVAQGRIYGMVPLSKILFDEKIKGYRVAKVYTPKQLDELKKSLISNGKLNLLNPLHTTVDADADAVRTIGGNRRLASLKLLTGKDNAGYSPLSDDTEVPVYIYLTSDRKEALRRAMTDNAFRRDFDDYERLTAIEDLDHEGLTVTEIAAASNISTDTVTRFLDIAKHVTLRDFLKRKILPYSKLSQLGKCIEKGEKVGGFITTILTAWEATAKLEKSQYEARCKRNGKKAVGAKMKLQAYLPAPLWNAWLESLADGRMPTGETTERKLNFAMVGDTLVIEGVKRDLNTATLAQLADDQIALKHAALVVSSAIARVKAGETRAASFRDSPEYIAEFEALTGMKPDIHIAQPLDEAAETSEAEVDEDFDDPDLEDDVGEEADAHEEAD